VFLQDVRGVLKCSQVVAAEPCHLFHHQADSARPLALEQRLTCLRGRHHDNAAVRGRTCAPHQSGAIQSVNLDGHGLCGDPFVGR
jgi:hypothetical protein